MYKKIALLSLVLHSFIQTESDLTPWLEIKPSYFFFTSDPMKHIYNHEGFEMQGSASIPVYHHLDVYGSVGYRHAKGHALNNCEESCEKTSLTVVPVDIGLKPVFNFCERWYWFFAMGPRFFYLHQHNDSSTVDCSIKGGGVGLFVNTGLNVLLADHFLLGIFGEYS